VLHSRGNKAQNKSNYADENSMSLICWSGSWGTPLDGRGWRVKTIDAGRQILSTVVCAPHWDMNTECEGVKAEGCQHRVNFNLSVACCLKATTNPPLHS